MFCDAGYLSDEVTDFTRAARSAYPREFELLDESSARAQQTLRDLSVNPNNPREILAATAFERLASTTQAAILLLEKGMIPQVHVLARSAIEAWFILAATVADEEFAVAFVRAEQHAQKKALERLLRGQGLHRTVSESEIAATEVKVQELTAELKSTRVRDFNTEEIAAIGNLSVYYLSVYVRLSMDAHVSIRSLDSALRPHTDGGVASLDFGPDIDGIPMAADILAEPIILALGNIASLFSGSAKIGFQDLHNRLAAIMSDHR